MDDTYHYTKEDVEKVLHFLSTNLPKFATPENAIKVLVYLHERTLSLEKLSANEIEAYLQEFEEI